MSWRIELVRRPKLRGEGEEKGSDVEPLMCAPYHCNRFGKGVLSEEVRREVGISGMARMLTRRVLQVLVNRGPWDFACWRSGN
jgi:hypothetical protein